MGYKARKIIGYGLLVLIIVWLGWLALGWVKDYIRPERVGSIGPPDTVYIRQPYKEPAIAEQASPERVIIYEVRDTVLRDTAEKRDIITGVTLVGDMLTIETISPEGYVTGRSFDVKDARAVTVNGVGEVEIKPPRRRGRLLKRIAAGAVAVGGAVLVVLLVK